MYATVAVVMMMIAVAVVVWLGNCTEIHIVSFVRLDSEALLIPSALLPIYSSLHTNSLYYLCVAISVKLFFYLFGER